jgi:hypothetical protein
MEPMPLTSLLPPNSKVSQKMPQQLKYLNGNGEVATNRQTNTQCIFLSKMASANFFPFRNF